MSDLLAKTRMISEGDWNNVLIALDVHSRDSRLRCVSTVAP